MTFCICQPMATEAVHDVTMGGKIIPMRLYHVLLRCHWLTILCPQAAREYCSIGY